MAKKTPPIEQAVLDKVGRVVRDIVGKKHGFALAIDPENEAKWAVAVHNQCCNMHAGQLFHRAAMELEIEALSEISPEKLGKMVQVARAAMASTGEGKPH